MSKKFDTDAYVSRWDDKLIPIMLVVIIASMIAVYAMNIWARPACTTHDYVFCGTPLGSYEQEGHHGAASTGHHGGDEAGRAHEPQGGPHTPPEEGAHEGHPH